MNKNNQNIKKRQKEETLRTLLELWADYDDYYTWEFLPVWGVVDGDKTNSENQSDNLPLSVIGKHPFFE